MKKPKGLLDAAISILEVNAKGVFYPDDIKASCEQAIRLLEAAGKLEKQDAIHTLHLLAEEWYSTSGTYGEGPDIEANATMKLSVDRIRALLESLPETEAK